MKSKYIQRFISYTPKRYKPESISGKVTQYGSDRPDLEQCKRCGYSRLMHYDSKYCFFKP